MALRFQRFVRGFHRILGLVLAAFLLVQAVSGAFLLYPDAVERQFAPAAHAVSVCSHPAKLDEVVASAAHVLPGPPEFVTFDLDGAPDRIGVNAFARDLSDVNALVDRCNLSSIVVRREASTAVSFARSVHASLLLGETGNKVFVAIGALLFVFAISGLYLWPGWRHFPAGFRLRRGARPFVVAYDIHTLTGICSSVVLMLLGLTGFVMAEHTASIDVFRSIFHAPALEPMPASRAASRRILDPLEHALNAPVARLPGARPILIGLPDLPRDPIELEMKQREDANEYGATTVWADRGSGAILRIDSGSVFSSPERFEREMLPIHMATFTAIDLRPVVLVAAVAIPVLVVNGIVLARRPRRGKPSRSARSDV